MGFLGLVLQSLIALFLIYQGYVYHENTYELNLAIILGAPIMFMFGSAIRHNAKSARAPRGFFALIKHLIVSYITGVIISALFFGLGFCLYYILVLRPAEGTGRF